MVIKIRCWSANQDIYCRDAIYRVFILQQRDVKQPRQNRRDKSRLYGYYFPRILTLLSKPL